MKNIIVSILFILVPNFLIAQDVRISVGESVVGPIIGSVNISFDNNGLVRGIASKYTMSKGFDIQLAVEPLAIGEYRITGKMSGSVYNSEVDVSLKITANTANFKGFVKNNNRAENDDPIDCSISYSEEDGVYRWFGNFASLISYSGPRKTSLSLIWSQGFQLFFVDYLGYIQYPQTQERYRYLNVKEGWIFCEQVLDYDYQDYINDGYAVHYRYLRNQGRFSLTKSIIDAVNFLILHYSGIGNDILALYLHDLYYPGLAQVGK
jgi:hypothetical protein